MLERAARLLAAAARRRAARAGAAHRPAAPAGADLPRRARCPCALPPALVRGARGARPARGRHAVHGAAGRLPGAAVAATSGQDDIVVGSPVAGRNRAETRGADRLLRQHPGAARATWPASPPSASCWRGCARRRWAPTPTRTCPSRSWSRSCSPSATSAARPLFQVMFALQNAPVPALRAARADAARRWTSDSGTRQVRPDALRCARRREGFARRAGVQHRPVRRRHRRAHGRRTSQTLLAAPSPDPDAPLVRRCRCSTEAERQQLLVEWNATAADYPREACRPRSCSRRRRRARRTRVAVAFEGTRSSPTRELDARANRLARHLRALGVGPEARVGALPGALAGAWWWRLLARPQGRRRLRAARPGLPARAARPSCWRTAGAPRAAHPAPQLRTRCPGRAARVVLPGRASAGVRRAAAGAARRAALARTTWPTSSTPRARPAGPRACRCRTARWPTSSPAHGAAPRLRARRRACSQSTTVSLRRLRPGALSAAARAAARVVLAPRDAPATGRAARGAASATRVTTLQCTPSLLRACCWTAGLAAALPRLRRCSCGGEALPRGRWRASCCAALRRLRCSTSTAPPRPPSGRHRRAVRRGADAAPRADRPADRQHQAVRAGRAPAAGAGRRAGRAVHRRRRRGPRLPAAGRS